MPSSASAPKPREARYRAVLTLRPRCSAILAARSRSGSSAASAASTCSARDPAPLEVVADQRVARAAGGELLRPRAGEALVVHVADPLERLERLLPLGRPHAALREARVELRGRPVAVAQRAERLLDGVGLLRHGSVL